MEMDARRNRRRLRLRWQGVKGLEWCAWGVCCSGKRARGVVKGSVEEWSPMILQLEAYSGGVPVAGDRWCGRKGAGGVYCQNGKCDRLEVAHL